MIRRTLSCAGLPLGLAVFLLFGGAAIAAPISGRVLGPDGAPVAGAQIVASRSTRPQSVLTRSDADGNFTLDLDWPERPLKPRDPPPWRAVALSPRMELGSAQWWSHSTEANAYDFHLVAGGTCSGVVQDGTGKPVANATVKVSYVDWSKAGENYGSSTFWVPSRLAEKFTTASDAAGRWTLPSAQGQDGYVSVRLVDPRFLMVEERGVLSADALKLTARRPATIIGEVVDDAGKPVAGVEMVLLYTNRPGRLKTWTTGKDGSYRVTGLDSGAFRVAVLAESGKWVGLPPADIVTVTIGEGATVQAPRVVATTGAVIRGVITDAVTGQPVPGVNLVSEALDPPLQQHYFAETDPQGRYEMRVPPGRRNLLLDTVPVEYIERYTTVTTIAELKLVKGDNPTRNFKLRKPLTVRDPAK